MGNNINTVLGRTDHYKSFAQYSQQVSLAEDGSLTSDYDWVSITLNDTIMESLSYTVQDIAGVAAHEFGHAIGLSHRNTNPQSLMCQTGYGRTVSVPQAIEVRTTNHLYPLA
ncbi:MAG: matrixin family metalloprotease [Ruminococcus sp.]|nr:matrixin family metalloprotease [Ruminococcus sp.]